MGKARWLFKVNNTQITGKLVDLVSLYAAIMFCEHVFVSFI